MLDLTLPESGLPIKLWFAYSRETNHQPTSVQVSIVFGDSPAILSAIAHCHPNDRFVKATGRLVAMRKLLSNRLNGLLCKKDTQTIWDTYFSKIKS